MIVRKQTLVYMTVLLAAVASAAAYWHFKGLSAQYQDVLQSDDEVEALRLERDAVAAERDRVQQRVDYLNSDPVEQEAAIRRNDLVRKDEIVYRVELPDDGALPADAGARTAP